MEILKAKLDEILGKGEFDYDRFTSREIDAIMILTSAMLYLDNFSD